MENQEPEDTGSQEEQPVEKPAKSPQEISKGLKIFDYILANICLLQFILQLYMKLSGSPVAPNWVWVIMPLLLASGLLSHEKWARILCIFVWAVLLYRMYLDYQMKIQEYMMQEMLRRPYGY
jgi:hypothetical protein